MKVNVSEFLTYHSFYVNMKLRWFTIFHWQAQMHIRCSTSTNLVNSKEITTGTFYLSVEYLILSFIYII